MEGPGNPRAFTFCSCLAAQSACDSSQKAKHMSHRFPPLRPPVKAGRKTTARAATASAFTLADLCLTATLVLSVALALI
jgi:hypothetical protein